MLRVLSPVADSIVVNSLIGLAVLLLTPLMTALFFVSILGSMVGALLLAAYLLLILTSIALVGPFLGLVFGRYVINRAQFDPLTVALGCFLLFVVVLVPFIGPVLVLLSITTVLGGLARVAFQR